MFLAAIFSVAAALPSPPARGYSAQGSEEEKSLEARYRSLASTEQIIQFHRYLTAEPHPAGSKRNNDLARWVADQWRTQGLEDVVVHRYDVLHSSPHYVLLDMVKPEHFHASLCEDAYEIDPDTKNPRVDGAYLGYSASGEITAPVVYAHSGNPEDYAYLKSKGIDDFEAYGEDITSFIQSLDQETHISAYIDIAPPKADAQEFRVAGLSLKQSVAAALASGKLDDADATRVNRELMQVERNWCNPKGIPGRGSSTRFTERARHTRTWNCPD